MSLCRGGIFPHGLAGGVGVVLRCRAVRRPCHLVRHCWKALKVSAKHPCKDALRLLADGLTSRSAACLVGHVAMCLGKNIEEEMAKNVKSKKVTDPSGFSFTWQTDPDQERDYQQDLMLCRYVLSMVQMLANMRWLQQPRLVGQGCMRSKSPSKAACTKSLTVQLSSW